MKCPVTEKMKYTKQTAKERVKAKGKGWRRYLCPHCDSYHLTTQSRNQRRRYLDWVEENKHA